MASKTFAGIKTFEARLPNGSTVWVAAATPAQARRIIREDFG